MTIDEFIKQLESKAELEKERAFYDAVKWNCITAYGAYCRKLESEYHQLAEWLKELKAHREAWATLREDIRDESELAYDDFDEYRYEVLGIDDVDDLPNDDYRYGMERALELIDIYRPKEGDAE